MDTNHSQQWVAQTFLLFIFRTMMRMMLMMMNEGQAYVHTQLALMRCLYSPRQNANISSILILIVQNKKIGLTRVVQDKKESLHFQTVDKHTLTTKEYIKIIVSRSFSFYNKSTR